MNKLVEVSAQEGFEKCIKEGNVAIVRKGNWIAHGSSQVIACDSSQVTACDSSKVTAYGSSQVTACDSSKVTAYDSSQVRAYGSSQVRAYGYVAITQHSDACKVKKTKTCHVIKVPPIKGLTDYLSRYPIEQEKDTVVLYKAVKPNLSSLCSSISITYPVKGVVEEKNISPPEYGSCARGLHFAHFDWAVSFGLRYGDFKIIKARIPKDKIVVSPDCDGKIRTSYAEIIEVIEDWQHYRP